MSLYSCNHGLHIYINTRSPESGPKLLIFAGNNFSSWTDLSANTFSHFHRKAPENCLGGVFSSTTIFQFLTFSAFRQTPKFKVPFAAEEETQE